MGVGGVVCHCSRRLCIMLHTLGTSTDGVPSSKIRQGLAISMIVSCLWRLFQGHAGVTACGHVVTPNKLIGVSANVGLASWLHMHVHCMRCMCNAYGGRHTSLPCTAG